MALTNSVEAEPNKLLPHIRFVIMKVPPFFLDNVSAETLSFRRE
jgi:hypothetical protein